MGGQHRAGIGADAQKPGVSQADLAGKTDQQVQPQHNHRVDRHTDGQIHIKTVGQHKGQHQQNGRNQVQADKRVLAMLKPARWICRQTARAA